MVDAVHIKHAFVLTKPDSPDQSIVSANEWNADELISGGQDGQFIARNSGVATGASYVHGVRASSAQETFSSAGVQFSPPIAALTVTYTSNCDVIFLVDVATTIGTGNQVVITIRRDGTNLVSRNVRSAGAEWYGFHEFSTEAPGSHTYDAVISAFTAGTLTQAIVRLTVLALGKL